MFAGGFVLAGVGSDVQGGILDVIGVGSGGQTGASVDDARDRVRDNPNDPEALRELAQALQTAGRPEEAADPLRRYTQLRPRDEDALRELAAVYLTRATRIRDQLQQAQLEAQALNPAADFALPATSPLGQALSTSPITQAVSTAANERITKLYGDMQKAYSSAKFAYIRLARVAPEDPNLQLQLADAAQNSGDTAAAIRAYKRFLVLAPDDPNAPIVKAEIKRLEAAGQLGNAVQVGG